MGQMPRIARRAPEGWVYHALNRAVARLPLFQKTADYEAFERVLIEAHQRSRSNYGLLRDAQSLALRPLVWLFGRFGAKVFYFVLGTAFFVGGLLYSLRVIS